MGCQATEDMWIVSLEEFRLISGGFDPGKQTMLDKNLREDNTGQMICQFGIQDQNYSVFKQREFSG